MNCYHIHITGRVQGVGFRPFIYRLANVYNALGWVSNTLNGVHIEAEGIPDINDFCLRIQEECPAQARIEGLTVQEIPIVNYNTFSIIDSSEEGHADMQVTPDFAICQSCLDEIKLETDRRFNYPFTTCTNCGPRFSIIRKLPYDRHLTTMQVFQQCDDCMAEYYNPGDRRFYSQTNSCPECSIQLSLYNRDKKKLSDNQGQIIDMVSDAISSGNVVAIKGVGGYLLCADATSAYAINNIRSRKNRPAKPFALMYPDLETAEKDVFLTDKITKDWESPESPIVLCRRKIDFPSGIQSELIAPHLEKIGIMMPYAPLFVLLMHKIKRPIIATSGNVSGSPIIFNDEEALDILSEIADLVLVNNRDIVVPQDDSVIQYSEKFQQRIILRRSRGMAPSFSYVSKSVDGDEVLTMGAMLKSAFGLIHSGRYYISQYLGDTSTLESQISYENTLCHMMELLSFSPSVIITDMHPDYPSTALGVEMANKMDTEMLKVQHHQAHSYAVLAENELLNNDRVLSVIWDGTGYGTDGQIWGGEYFDYSGFNHTRVGQWEYFPHILGDKMSLEPRISAFCLAVDIANAKAILEEKFNVNEFRNYNILLKKERLLTSSVGRIIDGVASLLGISDFNTYEGEAAMYLEATALAFMDKNQEFTTAYEIDISEKGILRTSDLFNGIVTDLLEGCDKGYIAAKFHVTLVAAIRKFIEKFNYQKVVFSGGVFQNGFLVDLIFKTLSDKYSVYFHKQLSPNDECIPFGQLIAYQVLNKKL